MTRGQRHILITGPPRVGKTTLVRRIAEDLARLGPVGFYTAEILERGVRTGFELVGFDGRRGLLSHVDHGGSFRVGRYGVDVDGFERFLDDTRWPVSGAGVIVIDEIGKMECFSRKFQSLIRRVLEADTPVIATVAARGGGLIGEVKRRADVELLELTSRNRAAMAGGIVKRFV